ncbi:MAG TPA: restriction endonuclease [Campylobacterales bacterium]|nr:restriction endonuclease [Campylobacterales bacterium]
MKDFLYFFYIFRKDNFLDEIEEIIKESKEFSKQTETDLKNAIYGTSHYIESVFRDIGQAIYRKEKNLDKVFEKSLYFLFRFLFILFFENKNRATILNHQGYKSISFETIFSNYVPSSKSDNSYTLYRRVVKLFEVLDKGSPSLQIPPINGGLFQFDEVVDNEELFSDREIYNIYTSIIHFQGDSKLKIDFKNISVTNLGSIYEGLLDYYFRVEDEEVSYVLFGDEKKTPQYILNKEIEKYKNGDISIIKEYRAGELYLVNFNNSRKESASYYTPESISSFMVQKAIDRELERKSILDIRILDNACGSGHFLVESLEYLTKRGAEILKSEENQDIWREVEKEKQEILENWRLHQIPETELSDIEVLKRLILKRSIFGVDLNPFAVEITKLALWIDSFIFGTPLSLIEHHIKQGNSLIGSTLTELKREIGKDLLLSNLLQKLENLKTISQELSEITDTTAEKINLSKTKFRKIQPKIEELNLYLNFLNTRIIKELEGDRSFSHVVIENIEEHREEIEKYTKEYSFFNYEVEFPEVFYNNSNSGFDIIIGNPPWEKVKFDEKDFFPRFSPTYRTLKNRAKKEVAKELLEIDEVANLYKRKKKRFDITNRYLSNRYPYNRGVGDNNLFRFFVEKNLSLLKKPGNLTYVLPSALFQDDGSITLRSHILEDYKLHFFFSFENRLPVFKDVDSRYKFAIIQVDTEGKTDKIDTFFYAIDPKDLWDNSKYIKYTISDIIKIAPHHQNLLEARTKTDLEIAKKAYPKFSKLDLSYMDFINELHMTNDKSIFKEENHIDYIPLYEGKMIHQFNPYFGEPNYYLDIEEFDKHIQSKELNRFIKSLYSQIPENYKVIHIEKRSRKKTITVTKKRTQLGAVANYLFGVEFDSLSEQEKLEIKEKLKQYIKFDREFFRIGFREVARDTDERTIIASLLPKNIGVANTIWSEIPKRYIAEDRKVRILENSINRKLFILAVFNSIVFDFLARLIVQIHVTKSILTRLPIPQPTEEELNENRDYQTLIDNTKKIIAYYSDDFDFEVEKPKTEEYKEFLEIENNIIVAKMFGISYQEMEYILSTFKVLQTKRTAFIETLLHQYRKVAEEPPHHSTP